MLGHAGHASGHATYGDADHPAGMPPTGMPAMPAGMPPTGMPAMPAMPLSGASRVGLVEKHGISKFDGLPPGKHSKNYGKSSFLMGKSTINDDFQ